MSTIFGVPVQLLLFIFAGMVGTAVVMHHHQPWSNWGFVIGGVGMAGMALTVAISVFFWIQGKM